VNGHKHPVTGEHVYGAAHRSLPFGTMLRLKGPSGNYATFVINDRGPFIKGRTLDIAKGAAGIVGILGRGVGTLCE
jgi:rare lipoprotein A